MNLFTHLLVASAFATGSLLPISSFAQATTEHDHSHASAASTASLTGGDVRKVDLESSKVTIKHGEEQKFVDAYFPQAVPEGLSIRSVNLRDEKQAETRIA